MKGRELLELSSVEVNMLQREVRVRGTESVQGLVPKKEC